MSAKAGIQLLGLGPGFRGDERKRAGSNEPLDVYVQAAAHVLELPLPPAWRDAVAANLQITLRLAAGFA